MVVDDSSAARSALRRMLHGLGWETLEAVDGLDALSVVDRHPYVRLALVDWNMPVMSGLDFVEAVRSDRRFDHIAVLMVTTENQASRVVAALDAGADEYLMKPFTRDVLAEKLGLLT